jgi:hypothetical protein
MPRSMPMLCQQALAHAPAPSVAPTLAPRPAPAPVLAPMPAPALAPMRTPALAVALALIVCTALSVGLTSPSAAAGSGGGGHGVRGWGPRLGVTVNPDQFHFGMHLDAGNFAERVRFQPNIEVGVGDHVTTVALNFEAMYRFRKRWDVWTPYAGGGLGLNFFDWDHGYGDSSDTELGVNALGGIEKGLSNGDRFFLELKLGLANSPDFKVTVGWTFE